jgi:glycosyltransferase involved in cell wall biosynthesis
MSDGLPRTIFVGRGVTSICWYRCALPAMALGMEWVGLRNDPPETEIVTGMTERPFALEHLFDYEAVVLQQPASPAWHRLIRRLQAAGIAVLFEIDDYIHAVRKMATHEARAHFGKEMLRHAEASMRMADGVICSTDYLARRYGRFNPRTFVCRNGLDLRRYDLERPARDGVVIGWAGGTGHIAAMQPWLAGVRDVMAARPETRFVTIGQNFAGDFAEEFGDERCLSVPFTQLETYPAAMTMFDVALAPSAQNNLFRGKSDLRWLEASALGIPLVADPGVYPEIEHGVTGFHAATPEEMRAHLQALVDDEALRVRVGEAARAHVRSRRSIQVMSRQWADVLADVAGARAAA